MYESRGDRIAPALSVEALARHVRLWPLHCAGVRQGVQYCSNAGASEIVARLTPNDVQRSETCTQSARAGRDGRPPNRRAS